MDKFLEGTFVNEDGSVQIKFKKTDGRYDYQDALNLSSRDYAALTEVQIEEMKQRRFDNWLAAVHPPEITSTDTPT